MVRHLFLVMLASLITAIVATQYYKSKGYKVQTKVESRRKFIY